MTAEKHPLHLEIGKYFTTFERRVSVEGGSQTAVGLGKEGEEEAETRALENDLGALKEKERKVLLSFIVGLLVQSDF